MKSKIFISLSLVMIGSLQVLAQEKLYPLRPERNVPVLLTSDRSAVVIEKAFQHKLTLGFPEDDRASFLPETRTPIMVFWLRVQNVSRSPMQLNISNFTATDDQNRKYSGLAPDDAYQRILAGASGGSIGTKTLRGISLGTVAGRPSEEQVKEDFVRYSLRSGVIPPGTAKEGLIYFEGPDRKKFTANIYLGDLWSQPLAFSTEKQK
jgi:hypothetical protein